jgi:hypothetical protein
MCVVYDCIECIYPGVGACLGHYGKWPGDRRTSFVYTVVTGEEVNIALIGSTVGVAAFLLVTGVVLLIVILSCYYFRTYQIRRKKMTT